MARLLWRGSLQLYRDDDDDHAGSLSPGLASSSYAAAPPAQLHGLAMVASSFTLSHGQPALHDPDDPFSSSSSPFKIDTTAELCLDIEMLRNAPLYLETRRARVKIASLDGEDNYEQDSNNANMLETVKPHGRKTLKKSIEMLRKGKQKSSQAPEIVYIDPEQDSNLSLYIDQRCHETVQYLNELFCKEAVDRITGRTSFGLAIALEREDELGISTASAQRKVVIYGQIAPGPHTSRPIMQLHVAKYRNKRQTGARPDAPAPRENLFAQKLRRTVSQPNMTLKGAPKPKATKDKPLTITNGILSSATLATQHTAKARNLFGKARPSNRPAGIPSDKTSSMHGPAVHGSPGRRGQKRPRLTAGGLRALEEVTENDPDLLHGEDYEGSQQVFSNKKMRNDRDGSPTPSIATNRSFSSMKGPMKTQAKRGGASSLMKRSMSMPPGKLDFGAGLAANNARGSNAGLNAPSRAMTREPSLAPTEMTLNLGDDSGTTSMETKNKGTIRKVLLTAMTERGCGREHEDFKDVFAVAYKGLQCTFRHTITKFKLDKERIGEMTERHLSMYLS